jgi:hypothetical protein
MSIYYRRHWSFSRMVTKIIAVFILLLLAVTSFLIVSEARREANCYKLGLEIGTGSVYKENGNCQILVENSMP